MKKYLFLIILLLQVLNGIAQTIEYIDDDAPDRDSTETETLPWFGNNQYLSNLLDSIGYDNIANRIVTPDIAKYKVPIKFWVYRRSDGTGGPNLQNIQNYIDNLNRVFNVENRTLISFYLKCDIGFINSDANFEIGGDGEAWNLIQNNKSGGCINIHIVGDYVGAAGVHIRARFFGRDGIVLNFAQTGGIASTTIAHEVGHYFELDHTHQYSSRGKCRKEPVDRNRNWPFINLCVFNFGAVTSSKICEATGDCLSDTPADPDLTSNFFNTTNVCSFNAQGNYNNSTDPWGDSYISPPAGSYQPNVRNVMSYNRDRACRINFSRLQIAVMIYSIERGKSKNNCAEWKDLKAEYDDFEMDNFAEVARPINLGVVQEHNFHQQFNSLGIFGFFNQCDIDWVRFIAPCTNNFDITTSSIAGRANANTRLTLFSNTMVQLAQNDNISSTDLFSNINFNFIAGQEYFIRVENMGSIATTYYNLSIGAIPASSIIGTQNICTTPATYTIQNLQPNSTVIWSVSNTAIVSIVSSGASCTLTKLTDGQVTLTARIFNPCYGNQILTLNIYAGLPYFGVTYKDGITDFKPVSSYTQNPNVSNNVCIGYNFPNVYMNTTPVGATNITWSVLNSEPQPNFIIQQQDVNRLYFNWRFGGLNNPIGLLHGNITNSCGSYSQTFAFKQVNCGTQGGNPCTQAREVNYYTISPNPANDYINIGVSNRHAPVECNNLKALTTSNGTIFSSINIYNNVGTLVKLYKTKDAKSANIQISNLIFGSYLVEIIQDDFVEKHQIIIQ